MGSEVEKRLFDIPNDIEFPMELNQHLKSKLHSVLDQNWQLKRHVDYLEGEVADLRRAHRNQPKKESDIPPPSSMMSSKIVELSKKNRDMTSQMESMKSKLGKLLSENEKLRSCEKAESNSQNTSFDQDSSQSTLIANIQQNDEDFTSSSQQISQVTNKMMEYRRQCQQLKIELKVALRALSQEVGETATPQNVFSVVSATSWMGRKQQIISLQQKIADMQVKLLHAQKHSNSQEEDLLSTFQTGCDGQGDSVSQKSIPKNAHHENGKMSSSTSSSSFSQSSTVSSTQFHRQGIIKQDMKKQEQIGKLKSQLDETTQELQNRQQDLKASKARVSTLESQTKSLRSQVDLLDSKLLEKDSEVKTIYHEFSQLKHEVSGMKDREKRNRDKSSLELAELNRTLARERAITARLQQVICEKQDALQKMDGEMIQLRNKLELCSSSCNIVGGLSAIEKIHDLEIQLCESSDELANASQERQRLAEVLNNLMQSTEGEREKVVNSQRQVSRVFSVLFEADKCIDKCLEKAQITDFEILKEVENIRSSIRELKTGQLYFFEQERDTPSAKTLKNRLATLRSEMQVLQTNFQNLVAARKADAVNFAFIMNEQPNDKKPGTDSKKENKTLLKSRNFVDPSSY